MPDTEAIVSMTVRLERADESVTVQLDGERRVRLDPQDSRSAGRERILEQLQSLHRPVYLEIDSGTGLVTGLRVPILGRVVSLAPPGTGSPGSLDFELDNSHARHVLRLEAPGAEGFERVLRDAANHATTVVLTEDDTHALIDVRVFVPDPEAPPLPPFPAPGPRVPWPLNLIPGLRRFWPQIYGLWLWPWWPWWWFRGISPARAQEVFDAMAATTCAPLTVPAPCIPFLYPDDGCWGRAHEMCRLMFGLSLSPRKVWIDHSAGHWLHVATRNNPNCFVEWGWHVAPTLLVRSPWYFVGTWLVIDPSLFTTPVTSAGWKGVQGDPAATLTPTGADQFNHGGGTDPTYAGSNSVLVTYRLALQARSLQVGPPPYANC